MDLQKTTNELLEILRNTNQTGDLKKYVSEIGETISFSEHLAAVIEEKALDKSQIIHASNIQRTYAYQIFDGRKQPGRDKVLALALAMKLSLDETQRMLTLSKNSILYAKNKRDSIITFGINRKLSVMEVNELLYEMGETTIE